MPAEKQSFKIGCHMWWLIWMLLPALHPCLPFLPHVLQFSVDILSSSHKSYLKWCQRAMLAYASLPLYVILYACMSSLPHSLCCVLCCQTCSYQSHLRRHYLNKYQVNWWNMSEGGQRIVSTKLYQMCWWDFIKTCSKQLWNWTWMKL